MEDGREVSRGRRWLGRLAMLEDGWVSEWRWKRAGQVSRSGRRLGR